MPHAASPTDVAGQPGRAPVIITVHGTNDALPDDHGQQWWQIGSSFAEILERELARRGVHDAEIVPHQWSGANSDADRLAAAQRLSRRIAELGKQGRPVALIGHSHGGNIVMESVTSGATARHVQRIATFGTPFFRRRLKAVPWLIAAFQIVFGLIITPIMIGYAILILGTEAGPRIEAAIVFAVLAILALLSLRSGTGKIFRQRLQSWQARRHFNGAHWMAIHSPRDEAMRVLEAAAELKQRYLTVESARRSIDAFAALAGVIGTAVLFVWLGGYFMEPIMTKVRAGAFGFATLVDFSFLLLVPVRHHRHAGEPGGDRVTELLAVQRLGHDAFSWTSDRRPGNFPTLCSASLTAHCLPPIHHRWWRACFTPSRSIFAIGCRLDF